MPIFKFKAENNFIITTLKISLKQLNVKSLIFCHGFGPFFHFSMQIELVRCLDIRHGEHFVTFLDLVPEVPIRYMFRPVKIGALLSIFCDSALEVVFQIIHVHALRPKKSGAFNLMDRNCLHTVVRYSEVRISVDCYFFLPL